MAGGNGDIVFTPEVQREFIQEYAKTGSISRAAENIGIDPQIVYYWKNHTSWGEVFENARQMLVGELEAEAYRRGVFGVTKNVYYQGEVVGEEKLFSDKLLVTLLRANDPSKYRYRDTLEDDDPRLDQRQVTVNIRAVPHGKMLDIEKVIDGSVQRPARGEGDSILDAKLNIDPSITFAEPQPPSEPNPGNAEEPEDDGVIR
ncbi:hypothetical protein SAMN04488498_101406 [Mesorhizobium albiziae]|uniref:Terminase small subunit n=1 Tax=Neomesorhizobium albiziae TaxID=335020 RepID=A0A1I3VI33_9HYPH|nr:helix-turn-helix domain-containing protein [Mesorhizobium albiziae]GLS28865.1 hypothetical protein GCM10007937_05720 [Mesorhizobium albiziae]SFJ93791.1 hypothetical protein SAMN04488498_101406 [Mesorhizobium albiziae]